jgi:1,4-dihydroxy-2-naphthoate octaprenyltransferase
MSRRRWVGFVRLADPRISLASVAAMVLGAAVAARRGSLEWGWLLLTALGVLSIEAAKNASGELFDFASGVDQAVRPEDRSPFSGGKRVLVDGLLTRRETAAIAVAAYAAGIAAGVAIAVCRQPGVLLLGLIGVGLAYFYHAPPLRLSYRGLGEAAVALVYGPLLAVGTVLVQRGEVTRDAMLLSIPLGVLIGAFLWINEFPDYEADRACGKRTLVTRLGRREASRVFTAIVLGAFGLVAALPAFGVSRGVWLGGIGLPFALAAARRLLESPEVTARIVPAQAWTLLSFLAYAVGASAGILCL